MVLQQNVSRQLIRQEYYFDVQTSELPSHPLGVPSSNGNSAPHLLSDLTAPLIVRGPPPPPKDAMLPVMSLDTVSQLTARGLVVDAGLTGAVLPGAATVAVGGAAEVGGVRVTGGGAAVL